MYIMKMDARNAPKLISGNGIVLYKNDNFRRLFVQGFQNAFIIV